MNAPGDKYPDLLSNISIAVTTADTLEDTFAPVLRLVCEATGWTTGHALTVSSEGAPQSTGIWHGAASFPKTLLDQFQTGIEAERVSGVKGLAERVLADGLPKWVSGDVRRGDHFPPRSSAHRAQLASGFAFPLRKDKQVVGVLEFHAIDPQNPDTELLKVMAQVGDSLGYVVRRQANRVENAGDEESAWHIINHAGEAFVAMDDNGLVTS